MQPLITLSRKIHLLKNRFQQSYLRLQAKNKDIKRIVKNSQKNQQGLMEFVWRQSPFVLISNTGRQVVKSLLYII